MGKGEQDVKIGEESWEIATFFYVFEAFSVSIDHDLASGPAESVRQEPSEASDERPSCFSEAS